MQCIILNEAKPDKIDLGSTPRISPRTDPRSFVVMCINDSLELIHTFIHWQSLNLWWCGIVQPVMSRRVTTTQAVCHTCYITDW